MKDSEIFSFHDLGEKHLEYGNKTIQENGKANCCDTS
jgi:hypothetical protein